jgi:flagellar hook-associated protein 1 FlgK
MSTFSGLSIGLSSLYAQRRGLELTGHNVANANTEGYSRQRLRLEADGGPLVPALHSRWNGAGNGVTTADVERLRDVFLEARSVQERGSDAGLRGGQVLLGRVETILSEPGDSGIQSQLADFWSGWDDVANQPDSLAARSQLLERSQTLATGLNGASERLEKQWSASREQLDATVQDVNATASSVAEYNRRIMIATKSGLSPHDLADQRDLMVQRLGQLAGVTLRPGDAGSVDVYLGGTALVRGDTAERLAATGPHAMPPPQIDPPTATTTPLVSVSWERDGYPVGLGGSAGGLVQGMNDVLPRHRDQLSQLSGALLTQVNVVHAAGFDSAGAPGGDFFVSDGSGRLTLAFHDPAKVAASDSADTYTDPTTGEVSGNRGGANAARLAELSAAHGGPDELYRQIVVALGVEAQTANRRVDIQTTILSQIDAAREAEAGVNLDEEMTSMLAYQRAYEGAARFVSAVDQMLDTLINRTGVVGR